MTTLFVDKLMPSNLGGIITDIKKIEFNLAMHNTSLDNIIGSSHPSIKLPTSMFSSGRFIAFVVVERDKSNAKMGVINHIIDLSGNFDIFADTFSPKMLTAFHDFQQKLRLKDESSLNDIVLSSDFEFFNKAYALLKENKI